MITKQITRRVIEWLTSSRTGMSSITIAAWLTFAVETRRRDHPIDPEDFNRCLMLFEEVPELRPYLHRMAKLSPAWKRLVARWDDIERCLRDEVGLNWSKGRDLRAAKTYDLIKQVLHAADDTAAGHHI